MMAAIAASRVGASVTVLERCERPGKKILATGNGRCNLSNLDFCVERDYRTSQSSAKLSGYFRRFGVEDTLAFFHGAGMRTVEKDGYVYPRSMQAATVSDFLQDELTRLGVRVISSCQVRRIRKGKAFTVFADREEFSFDRLILACGSAAGLRPSQWGDGYALAGELGLKLQPLFPALTGLFCAEKCFKELAGVRCRAKIRLFIEKGGAKREVYEEEGELQLTDYGISGIPVFQCSRYAGAALAGKKRVQAQLDFCPEFSEGEWARFCAQQYENCRGKSVMLLGEGILHKKIVRVLAACCKLPVQETVGEESRERIFLLFAKMRSFGVQVVAVNAMEQAQVCAGGVDLSEVDENLQAKKIPGLFLCGEMLDVDGRCGGYNLQWAWSSGYIAGQAAAGRGLEGAV